MFLLRIQAGVLVKTEPRRLVPFWVKRTAPSHTKSDSLTLQGSTTLQGLEGTMPIWHSNGICRYCVSTQQYVCVAMTDGPGLLDGTGIGRSVALAAATTRR